MYTHLPIRQNMLLIITVVSAWICRCWHVYLFERVAFNIMFIYVEGLVLRASHKTQANTEAVNNLLL